MALEAYTHTYIHTHTFTHQSDLKKPGAPATGRHAPSLKTLLYVILPLHAYLNTDTVYEEIYLFSSKSLGYK